MMAILHLFKRGASAIEDERSFPGPATPIDHCRYAVIDTELTGLDFKQDSIVSIGAVAMTGGSIHLGETFYEMVSPRTAFRSETVVVHGIMPSEVVDKPGAGAVISDLLKFCDGTVVVGHFLSLDLHFLNKELTAVSGRPFPNLVADTWRIHSWIQNQTEAACRDFGESGDRDLFALAKKYNIPIPQAHDALGDAFITAQLFQRFLTILPGLGVGTIKDLLKIGKP
jgi:DNA polymerase-3 subunit epsilon